LPLEAIESGVERALWDGERLAGDLMNALRHCPTVLRLERQRFEDQEVERPLGQVEPWFRHTTVVMQGASVIPSEARRRPRGAHATGGDLFFFVFLHFYNTSPPLL